MSSPVTNRTVNIYINHDAAQRSLQKLETEAKKLETAIEKGRKVGKDMTAEIEKLGNTKQKISDLQGMIDGKLAPSFQMVKKRVAELRKELDGMSQDAPGYAAKFETFQKVSAQLQEMKAQVNGVDGAMNKAFGSGSSVWGNIKQIAVGTLIGQAVMEIPQQVYSWLSGMVSGNAKLADSLADVRKATGLTVDQVKDLNREFSKIDTRTKSADLREIAVGLGQIGEAANKENVQNIDRIVVALGDEFGGGAREITTTLGTLRNNLQDMKTGNYGDDVLKIGNALNVLGAEGLATAPVITDFANRMSGIATTFGATSGQILGLSAMLQELGVPAERGATAVTKLLQKVTSETGKFANLVKQAGMDSNAFVKQVNTDVVGALVTVAAAARKAGSDNQTFGRILKDLDADGAGAGEVLSKLAQNEDMLAKKINLASDALTKTNSITGEFNLKNNNLAGTLEKVQKQMIALFMNGAVMNDLESIINWFGKLVGAVDETDLKLQEMAKSIDDLNKQEKALTPLIDRYDELSKKTNLSAEEQGELKNAIEEISAAIPYAITKFDQYGKAISISSESAREFLRLKRLMLQEENRDNIADSEELIDKLRGKQQAAVQKKQSFILLMQTMISTGNKEMMNEYNKNAQQMDREVDELNLRIEGIQAKINQMKGLPLTGANAPIEINLPHDYSDKSPASKPTPPKGKYTSEDDLKKQQQDEARTRNKLEKIEALKQRIQQINEEVDAMERDRDRNDQAADERQIARITNKYARIIAEAKKLMVDTAQLNDLQRREIGVITEKQFSARSEKEYGDSLQSLHDFIEQEKQAAKQAYATGQISHEEYSRRIIQIEHDEANGRMTIANDYADTSIKAAKDLEAAKTQAVEQGVRDRDRLDKEANENRLYALQYALLIVKKGTQEELDARIALLQEGYAQEIAAAEGNATKIKLLEAQREQEITDLKRQHMMIRIGFYMEMATTVVSAFSTIMQAVSAEAQAELDKDRLINDAKKKNYQDQLNNKRITKAQYDKLTQKADDELAKKERAAKVKEFKRNQAISLGQALMNGAQAITSIWAQYGATPYIAAILTAIAAAANGIQIGTIASQKPPAYAKGRRPEGDGGMADGPSHAGGGIKMVRPDGTIVGEMEGDEAILSKETVKNNRELANALLDASMYNGGRRISWYRSMPAPINYDRVSSSFQKVRFANGRYPVGDNSGNGFTAGMPQEWYDLFLKMHETLSKPQKNYVVWKDIQEKQSEYEGLVKAGSLRRNS